MKSIVKHGVIATAAALLLSGCGSVDGKRDSGPVMSPASAPTTSVRDVPVKLGPAFTVAGTTYTPVDVADYDDVGYASRYSGELDGQTTANGEIFNSAGISAAHKTLPLPSYVEVTALDTGRTILVRVNDRGPMVKDRLIDLSNGAADQLGLKGGIAAVRVRRTNPPESERVQLRRGLPVAERLATSDSLLAILRKKISDQPKPLQSAAPVTSATSASAASTSQSDDRFIVEGRETKPKPLAPAGKASLAAAGGDYVVQVAAFSSKSRADVSARSVGGQVSKAGNLWRVRIGPFTNEAEALSARQTARSKGYGDARVIRDR